MLPFVLYDSLCSFSVTFVTVWLTSLLIILCNRDILIRHEFRNDLWYINPTSPSVYILYPQRSVASGNECSFLQFMSAA